MEKSQVGLDSFYCAEVLTDTSGGCTYDTPVAITGAIAADVKANGSIETQFADDGPADNASNVGKQEVALEFTNLTPARRAWLLGHTVTSGVVIEKPTDTPKVLAIGFRSEKTNGAYRYIWYLKGQFSVPDDSYKTRGEKVAFGTTKLLFSGLRRDYDKEYKVWADSDDAAVAAGTITNWFVAAPVTIATPDALTITMAPTDPSTDVAINISPTITYNNAINAAYLTSNYFYLLKVSDGTKVTAALSIDAANKVVTLNPGSDLTNSAAYILVASGLVKDIYGQVLAAGDTFVNITCVA